MVMTVFADRRDAGAHLALELQGYAERPDVVVVATPRGGIPVGYEIAVRLGLPLVVFDARRLYQLVPGDTFILATDGVEHAASMIPTLTALRRRRPDQLVAAIPVACAEAYAALTPCVDEIICLLKTSRNIERAYRDLSHGSEAEARHLIERAAHWREQSFHGGPGWLASFWMKAARLWSFSMKAVVGSGVVALF